MRVPPNSGVPRHALRHQAGQLKTPAWRAVSAGLAARSEQGEGTLRHWRDREDRFSVVTSGNQTQTTQILDSTVRRAREGRTRAFRRTGGRSSAPAPLPEPLQDATFPA